MCMFIRTSCSLMSNIKFLLMKETTFIEGQKFSVKLTFMPMQSKDLKICVDICTDTTCIGPALLTDQIGVHH